MSTDTAHTRLHRPVYLTREQGTLKLTFAYDETLVEKARQLPYARFDRDTRTWTVDISRQAVDQLREWYTTDGLTDICVDELITPGESLPDAPLATVRRGSSKRPFLVLTGTRDETLYARLKAIPGAQWERQLGGLSYPATSAAALGELAARGILADPEHALAPAAITVTFDGRTGTFKVLGDLRAQVAFDKHFPDRDVITEWQQKGFDVALSDPFTEEVYRGEIARARGGLQPTGLLEPLFPYQAESVAVAVERTGFGVFDQPGLGKCLLGHSTVWTADGPVPIQDLWDTCASAERSTDGEGEWADPSSPITILTTDGHNIRPAPVHRLYRQHIDAPVRTVSLRDGSQVTGTLPHRYLVEGRGWVCDVQPGDRIAVPRRIPHSGQPRDLELVELLAWTISEGHETVSARNEWAVRITQLDETVLHRLAEITPRICARHGLNRYGLRLTGARPDTHTIPSLRICGSSFGPFWDQIGHTQGKLAAGKRIPEYVMTGDLECSRAFLRHYYAAEGHVGKDAIEMVSASPELMEQLAVLLRRHGIWMRRAVRHKAATNGSGIDRPYTVGLISGDSAATFAREIGVADPAKDARARALATRARNSNLETVDALPAIEQIADITGYSLQSLGVGAFSIKRRSRLTDAKIAVVLARVDDIATGANIERARRKAEGRTGRGVHSMHRQLARRHEEIDATALQAARQHLERLRDSDLLWVEVTDVQIGHHTGWVYDLEVTDTHNYVAAGLVCHNTAQAIGWSLELIENRHEADRVVIVVPGAVKTQFGREITRFTGHTDVVVVDGPKKKRDALYEQAKTARWVVLNYDLLHLDYKQIAPLVAGQLLVADEAHRVKNRQSKRTQAMRQLAQKAARRLALTGTPVENNPAEWYTLMNTVIAPGILGSPAEFFNRYSYPGRFGGYEGARNLHELRDRSRPHYIRHTKKDVATHLPPLTVQNSVLDADDRLAAALKRAHRDAQDEIKAAQLDKRNIELLDGERIDEIESGAAMTAVGMLRLLCSSPRLVHRSDADAAKAMVGAGLIPDDDGPKLDQLRELCSELQAAGERVVVFTSFRTMAELISDRLTEDGIRHVTFTGASSTKERDAAVLAFTSAPTPENPGPTVFLATDAASEGLNLGKQCSTLVNFDLAFKPSTMIQRANRIHRVDGDTTRRYVVINYTISRTIEEGILAMVGSKADLSDAILGESGTRRATTGRGGRNVFEQALAAWRENDQQP